MGNQYRVAGKSTREGGRRKRGTAVGIAVVAIIAVLIGAFLINNAKAFGLGGIAILIILVGMRIIPDIIDRPMTRALKQERQYIRGARGEEQVGEFLTQLGNDYVVTHDVVKYYGDNPYGNIDHIVYDKKGNIFMLETKSHHGRVSSDGSRLFLNGHPFEKDIVAQSLGNTMWLKEKIEKGLGVKAWITPVLVFTNAFVEFGKPIKGVYYTNKKFLLQFLQRTNASSPAGLKLWEMREKEGPRVEQGR